MTSPRNGTRRKFIAGACTFFASGSVRAEEWASSRPAGDLMDAVMWTKEPIGGPFSLIDHHGARRTESDFAGLLMVVYFGYLSCPDICPTELVSISQALERLGPAGETIRPIFITLDPERDTSQALAGYLESISPRFIGLTGSPAEIRRVAQSYRVYFAKVTDPSGGYSIDHMGFVYLIGRNGQYLGFLPPGTTVERMAEAFTSEIQSR